LTFVGGRQYNPRIVTDSSARRGNPTTGSEPERRTQPRFTFRRIDRIPEGEDFVVTVRRGSRVTTTNLRTMWRRNGLDRSRLGVSVGRKFGRAVARNRLKRLARETFRHATELRGACVDVVIVAHNKAVLDAPGEIAEALALVLKRVRPSEGESEPKR
jgi:ribonuclease P protein component